MFDVTITQEYEKKLLIFVQLIFPSMKLVYWGLFFSLPDSAMIYAGNKSININTHVAIVITGRESTVAVSVAA